jgi:DNA-binding NarL/FixJ family response regulator
VPKILVIEDHTPMRRNLIKILEMEGFQTVAAENGRRGLELAAVENPDLILCDIMMPGVDGYAVLQALRDKPASATTPFIFLTAKGEKFDYRVGMNLGADDYLSKPVGCEDLLAAINSRLARKHAHDDRAASLAPTQMEPDFTTATPLEQLGLTPREAEVLLWVTQGKTNSDIAVILRMAEATVKTHLGHVFEKLGVESRTAATLRAVEILSRPVKKQEPR